MLSAVSIRAFNHSVTGAALASLCVWKWTTSGDILDANQDCSIGFGKLVGGIAQSLALTRKIGNRRGSEGLRSFNPSKGTNLLILIILA